MDSPAEFGPIAIRRFAAGERTFRLALHHTGTDAELDGFVKDVEKIVREEGTIYGEYPPYEPGHYTFLADYLPYAADDAMEHRNSTVMTSSGSLRNNRIGLLDTVAHEFFHGWNVERIRPRSLEPFDFERVNMSGELWLAEGFTQYYGALVLSRTGLVDAQGTAATLAGFVASVMLSPARTVRSAEDMSRMAAFTDGSDALDRTNWPATYISYYDFGGAIALALDLTLRDRSAGRLTLDDYMRAMWRVHGKPGGSASRIRRSAVHASGRRGAAGGGERRPAICPRLLRALCRGARGGRLREAAGARGARPSQAQPRTRVVGRHRPRRPERRGARREPSHHGHACLRRRSGS